LKAEILVEDVVAFSALAAALSDARGGRSEIVARVTAGGNLATLCLGRDFVLDAEIRARLEALPGVLSVAMSAADMRRPQLVA
jgi:DNA polymerase III subunit alpha